MSQTSRFVALTLAIALVTPAVAAPPNTAHAAPRPWLSTAGITRDAKLAKLIDSLAGSKRVDSPKVFYSGRRSKIYARFERLIKASPTHVALRLLRHRSPIVRAYAAEHVIKRLPALAKVVYPLLRDRTKITTQSGCIRMRRSVASQVLDMLADGAKHPAVKRLIARAARDSKLAKALRTSARASLRSRR